MGEFLSVGCAGGVSATLNYRTIVGANESCRSSSSLDAENETPVHAKV